MTKQQLFEEIDAHLCKDATPSQYLNTLLHKKEFKEAPFRILYLQSKTEQSPVHHPEGNAWVHTLMVVDEASKVKEKSKEERVFMWAAFLHDIGKPETTRLRKGRITSYDHDAVGERRVKEFLSEFACDETFIRQVAALVRYHMHILYVTKNLQFARVSNMKKETDIREVALLGYCDRMGRLHANQEEERKTIQEFYDKLTKK